jgi:cell wall-associated NlpC family hydrolase
VTAVVLACLGALGGIAYASITAVNDAAGAAPAPGVQMVQAMPAQYRPVPQAAAAAQTIPQRMGQWTPQRGIDIANRALQWLNWPYSFAAGGENGPSYGRAVDKDSRNDAHVYGFDCSGLTMYALAPWRHLVHNASAQYAQVGSYHPSLDTLQPGDLVFWSKDGTVGGIGHVAIYLGNGYVVQAPHSGDVIRETPIYAVESGRMGATRPLT